MRLDGFLYTPGNKYAAGQYEVVVPNSLANAWDGPIDEANSQASKRPETERREDSKRNDSELLGSADRNGEGTSSGMARAHHSKEQEHEHTCAHDFDVFWGAYPKRNGRKVGKAKAKNVWHKIPASDRADVMLAVKHYAVECNGFPKDAERFLRNGFWRDYLEQAEPDDPCVAELDDLLSRAEVPA